jgi:hypothetical protein
MSIASAWEITLVYLPASLKLGQGFRNFLHNLVDSGLSKRKPGKIYSDERLNIMGSRFAMKRLVMAQHPLLSKGCQTDEDEGKYPQTPPGKGTDCR